MAINRHIHVLGFPLNETTNPITSTLQWANQYIDVLGLFQLNELQTQFLGVVIAFLTFVAAACAVGVAAWQLGSMAGQIDKMEDQTEAMQKAAHSQVFLDLDARWESDTLHRARKELLDLLQEISAQFTLDRIIAYVVSGEKADNEAQEVIKQFSQRLDELFRSINDENEQRYRSIMALCSFFETVGFMMRSDLQYVKAEHAYELFGGSGIVVIQLCGEHIQGRQREMRTTKFMENALSLGREFVRLERQQRQIERPTV